jgi:hypothetical protein
MLDEPVLGAFDGCGSDTDFSELRKSANDKI